MIIPCLRKPEYEAKVAQIAEILRTRSHELDGIGLSEEEFYGNGYFRAAIEKIRGQQAAAMSAKRAFMRRALNYMEDSGLIVGWSHAEARDRHDYTVSLDGGYTAVIEQKGCLDGNNVNISERPPNADEFYIWSICTNYGSNIAKGVRSAIMRITAEMIATEKRVDGIIVWDMICGSSGRPCPKLNANPNAATTIGPHVLPPPCLYLFPATIAHTRLNPKPPIRPLQSLKFANALLSAFKGGQHDVNYVEYEVRKVQTSTQRMVQFLRNGTVQDASRWVQVKRVRD